MIKPGIALLYLITLTACQSTTSSPKNDFIALDQNTQKAASYQLATTRCFKGFAVYVQQQIESQLGVSQGQAWEIRQAGAQLPNATCQELTPFKEDAEKEQRRKSLEQKIAAEKAMQHKAKELADKIERLNSAGEGEIKVCELSSRKDTLKISYSNRFNAKAIALWTYDDYVINSVHIRMNKSKAQEFSQFLKNIKKQAQENADIETLQLGSFSSSGGSILATSRNGRLSTFWTSDRGVDDVLLFADVTKISSCIEEIIPNL
ncbi:hypothetical protein [Grimontia hollisae]|uniref:hypothetical protein n=1 Tax=Grimontia hollisae TaxID=673 RepID=UPI001303E270|nr:hypothetical protein [Grimontia hollisae]